jgi:transposase
VRNLIRSGSRRAFVLLAWVAALGCAMKVYVCITWDTWRHRRLHPAFACGALLIAAEDLRFIWHFLSTPTWTHFATWLVS